MRASRAGGRSQVNLEGTLGCVRREQPKRRRKGIDNAGSISFHELVNANHRELRVERGGRSAPRRKCHCPCARRARDPLSLAEADHSVQNRAEGGKR